jgi:hypothetical protein
MMQRSAASVRSFNVKVQPDFETVGYRVVVTFWLGRRPFAATPESRSIPVDQATSWGLHWIEDEELPEEAVLTG